MGTLYFPDMCICMLGPPRRGSRRQQAEIVMQLQCMAAPDAWLPKQRVTCSVMNLGCGAWLQLTRKELSMQRATYFPHTDKVMQVGM